MSSTWNRDKEAIASFLVPGLIVIWLALVAFLVAILFSGKAEANTFHPSRVRLLAHGSYQFDDALGISGHFIPAGNLMGELAPLAYMTIDWTPTPYLTISPCLGWSFKPDEVITSLRLTPKYKDFYGWVDFEVRPRSWSFYWFAQAEWKAATWLHLGVEEESWGGFEEFSQASHGGGPNVLFRFGKVVGMDFTMHARQLDNVVRPEFFLRFHLFFDASALAKE